MFDDRLVAAASFVKLRAKVGKSVEFSSVVHPLGQLYHVLRTAVLGEVPEATASPGCKSLIRFPRSTSLTNIA